MSDHESTMTEQRGMSRRSFVKACAATAGLAAGVAAGAHLPPRALSAFAASDAGNGAGAGAGTSAEGIGTKEAMTFTRTTCSPNCTGACGMLAGVQDGRLKTIIQAADYPDEQMNPRGCLKGLSMASLVYGPNRLTQPMLRRDGTTPGTDDFEAASWDTALNTVAERLGAIAEKYGPDSIGVVVQVAATGHVHKGALSRLAALAGWTMHGGYDMNGDLPMSYPMTFGVQSEENESCTWPDSRYFLVFGSNLMATRLPDAQLLLDARKAGAKMVVFDPHYSVTAAKADEWHSISLASDAALALGMANVIISKSLHDADFLKTYTDMPLLVRSDTGKRLLASDVAGLAQPQGLPEYRRSYVFADASGALHASDPQTLRPAIALADIALEGSFEVPLAAGGSTTAQTAFSLLREQLEDYTPAKAAGMCGVSAADIERIATEAATTRPLHVIYGASNYQWYHGDLKGRALSLLPVLTGNIGNLGGGFSTYAGQYRMRFKPAAWWKVDGRGPGFFPFEYLVHGPTETMSAPRPTNGIKALVLLCCNPFDQHNLNNELRRQAEQGELEYIVNLDFQKTTTSLYSHALLPGVSWYEKTELVTSPVHQYAQLMQPAIEPVGQCKPELWVFRELAKRLNPAFEQHFYPELDANEASREVIRLLLATGGPEVEGITLEQLEAGPVELRHGSYGRKRIPFYEQIHEFQPFPPASYPEAVSTTAQFVKSGRIEFYKDEDCFLELGEALPVHKPPFEESEYALDASIRERYRFAYLTRNSIHRVHSTHANNAIMLELQGQHPRLIVNPADAAAKGVQEGADVECYNDRGRLLCKAVLDPGVQAGSVIFEQGWWEGQAGGSYNSLIYPHIKPTHEIYFVPQMWSPNTNWNECLVDFRKAGA
jgi:anaerobic selenocysteine-containing dehydrogenase